MLILLSKTRTPKVWSGLCSVLTIPMFILLVLPLTSLVLIAFFRADSLNNSNPTRLSIIVNLILVSPPLSSLNYIKLILLLLKMVSKSTMVNSTSESEEMANSWTSAKRTLPFAQLKNSLKELTGTLMILMLFAMVLLHNRSSVLAKF